MSSEKKENKLNTSWTSAVTRGTKFKWLDKLSKKSSQAHKKYPSFLGFKFGNLKVLLGDCILIRCNPHGTDGVEDFDVARLMSCYDIGTNKDNLRGCVQWYSRVRDIKGIEDCLLPPGTAGNALQPEHEVLLEKRKFSPEIDLETIVALCYVEECAIDVLPTAQHRPAAAGTGLCYFVCRLAYGPTTVKGRKCRLTPIPKLPAPVAHSSVPYSPGKENIPPCSDVSRSNTGGKRQASPSPPRSSRDARPSKRPRAVLQPVTAAHSRSPAAAAHSHTPATSGTPTSKKTPNRNLDSAFNNVDSTLANPDSASNSKSPKEKMKDLKKKGVSRKLDDIGINSALEAIGDGFDEGESDTDSDTGNNQEEADVKPPVRVQDFLKTKTFSASNSWSGNDCEIADKYVTPTKAGKSKISKSLESRETPKRGRGKLPSTPKTIATPISRRLSVAKGTPTKIAESSPAKGTPSRRSKQVTKGTPGGKVGLGTPRTKGTRDAAGTPSSRARDFVCSECGASLRNKNDLEDHMEDEHDQYEASPEKTPTPKKNTKKKSVQKVVKRPGRKPISTTVRDISPPPAAASRRLAASATAEGGSSALQRARERLHVCAVPDSLPCREEECQHLYDFIESKLNDGTGGCMYISGVPGTGKTATVREVVRLLRDTQESGDLPEFTFVEVNALKLSQPRQVWVEVWRALTGQQRTTPDHASQLLERRFRQPGPRAVPTLLLVDELDLLWTRKQDVLYNLFEWPNLPGSQLIVVAIANTMDLPERVMMARVASRLGLTRVTFHPYTHHQLQEIVSSRLSGIEGFDSDAVQLVARKVAAVSGDARRALDICRRATELAEADTTKTNTSPNKRSHLVGLKHVDLALKEMFTSPNIMAIRCCSKVEQQVLRSVLAEFQRTGLEETTLDKLYAQFLSLSAFDGQHKRVTLSCVVRAVNRLSGQRLLITDPSSRHLGQRVTLNLSVLDVKFALDSPIAKV